MKKSEAQIVLASASARRRELLGQMGVSFMVRPADIDEQMLENESPEQYVRRLAAEKSAARFSEQKAGLPVLGADTIVVLDNDVLGKPAGRTSALAMLERLSGRQHRVMTAVSVRGRDHWQALSETRVWFRKLHYSEVAEYWATGEPCDKAGAYAIQGVGGLFVQRIEGSYSGVVGLPIYETAVLLKKAGIGLLVRG
ncbi:MAG: nucleoside triphosphate pyrophosphatase [Pseudomonadota bacterium]|nr:nucleoside triphosphate pyrophosphatase [Pseudomonadota bacterium]